MSPRPRASQSPRLPAPLRALGRALHDAALAAFLHNASLLVRLGLRLACQARVAGRDRVPRRGGLLVAANHASFADPVILQAHIPRHLTYLMTDKYYFIPGLHAFARFYRVLCLRARGPNKAALRAAVRILEAGGAAGIFPEGAISRDGVVHDALPGIGLLAQRAGVPVLPVGLAGTERLMPPDTWRLHRARVALYFGEPLRPAGESRQALLGRINEAIHDAAAEARRLVAQAPPQGLASRRPEP
ncbi:MAG: lysophospholipid acyltransferase family protein [Candidatus Brocadiia bacterium]